MAQILSRVAPSQVSPHTLIPQSQKVDYNKYFGLVSNYGTEGDARFYIPALTNINTIASVGQQWESNATRQQYTTGQIGAPYYRINAYFDFDKQEASVFERTMGGISLQQFLLASAEQAIEQRKMQGLVLGFNAGEGIVGNATIATLPQDSANSTKLTTYKPAELQQFLSKLASDAMANTFNMSKPIVITSSTRVINYLATAIVPLTQSQQNGGGVDSVLGLHERVCKWLGIPKVEIIANDLLRETSSGKDTILIIAPEIDSSKNGGGTNAVGELNGVQFNTTYDIAGALQVEPNAPHNGRQSVMMTLKLTSGITLRSEAVVKVEVEY